MYFSLPYFSGYSTKISCTLSQALFCCRYLHASVTINESSRLPLTYKTVAECLQRCQMWAGVVIVVLFAPEQVDTGRTVTGSVLRWFRWCERTECHCEACWSPQPAVTFCHAHPTQKNQPVVLVHMKISDWVKIPENNFTVNSKCRGLIEFLIKSVCRKFKPFEFFI